MDSFKFLDWLRGCAHRRTTFPITLQSETYIACLDCGRHLAYDWTTMRVASRRGARLVSQTVQAPANWGLTSVCPTVCNLDTLDPYEAEPDGGSR